MEIHRHEERDVSVCLYAAFDDEGNTGRQMIQIKRVYESPAAADGARFLVERLWPRGIAKAALRMDAWLKDAAPTTELRRWFNHDPERWAEFKRRYRFELSAHPGAWAQLITKARSGRVTLLYSAHDVEHNNAVALRDFLNAELKKGAFASAGARTRAAKR